MQNQTVFRISGLVKSIYVNSGVWLGTTYHLLSLIYAADRAVTGTGTRYADFSFGISAAFTIGFPLILGVSQTFFSETALTG